MNSQKGWVKLHRVIMDHWIWDSERHSKQSAWMDLIMMVNHADNKITIGNHSITIHEGQVWTSYKKLKERWQWSNDRLKGFIDMLVADKMIAVNPTNTGTLITVLNYKKYQGSGGSDSEEPVRESVRESDTKPETESVSKSVTNKNDRRMNKNVKKGAGRDPGRFEA